MIHYDDPTPEERQAMHEASKNFRKNEDAYFDEALKRVQKHMQKNPGPITRTALKEVLEKKGIPDRHIGNAIIQAITFRIIYWRVDGLLEAGKAVDFDFELGKR